MLSVTPPVFSLKESQAKKRALALKGENVLDLHSWRDVGQLGSHFSTTWTVCSIGIRAKWSDGFKTPVHTGLTASPSLSPYASLYSRQLALSNFSSFYWSNLWVFLPTAWAGERALAFGQFFSKKKKWLILRPHKPGNTQRDSCIGSDPAEISPEFYRVSTEPRFFKSGTSFWKQMLVWGRPAPLTERRAPSWRTNLAPASRMPRKNSHPATWHRPVCQTSNKELLWYLLSLWSSEAFSKREVADKLTSEHWLSALSPVLILSSHQQESMASLFRVIEKMHCNNTCRTPRTRTSLHEDTTLLLAS